MHRKSKNSSPNENPHDDRRSANRGGWLYNPQFPHTWTHATLYSLAAWINGLAFRDINFGPTGKPVIKIAEIKDGISGQTKFTEQEFDESVRVRFGDLLFSWSGQPESSIDAFWWRGPEGWLNQHVFRVTPSEAVDRTFFFYLLRYLKPNFIGIARNKQTTGLGHVTKADLERIQAAYPPFPEQRAIAHILGTLDDKIELNRRMNETLETMARAIFKSWFVDFDPVRAKAEGRQPSGMDAATAALFPDSFEDSPLGEIPKGWRVCEVGKAVEVGGGSTPSTKESAYWDGQIHWATPKDLSALRDPVLLDTERRITQAGVEQIGSRVYPEGTVLLSSRAPIGYLGISEVPVAVNQGMIAMVCGANPTNHYMLHWTRENMDSIESRASGTTFQEISKSNFRSIPLAVPTDNVMRAFTERVEPLHRQIVVNVRQSRTLAAIRDSLLPKLIAGEIRVPSSYPAEVTKS
jgi:type I restriction enzyme S subunit